ncbi:6-phosphogluconolactonase [Lysinibacter sp. HNR]|uniref:6-phosphogluconolactonase n=1 Tax=Lysinibacter sp. HNR TaxID=3031408 RepID=UPI0024356299|nr:6-phosphogluconolactonase [Lysinibacter sp. HNR]WGD36186.1 6-phosphogluconolactonase [Lysinibacter sp. HNR]
MTKRDVVISADAASAAQRIAADFIGLIANLQSEGKTPRVILTGGSLGIELLRVTAQHALAQDADWENVLLYWGDERWLPSGHDERNDEQALRAFLQPLNIPRENIFPAPVDDGTRSLDEAAAEYSATIDSAQAKGFDLLFLGVGPDGHIASLFPHRDDLTNTDSAVIPVRNSPKPPPERLSLSYPVLNSADRVWLLCTGAAKQEAYERIMSDTSVATTPAAGVQGRIQTRIYADAESASE